MARELQRFLINEFRGLGLSGQAAIDPVVQVGQNTYAAYLSAVENLHTPSGILTNKNVGYVEHSPAAPDAGGKPYRMIEWFKPSSGQAKLLAIINGYLEHQNDADGTWLTAEIASGLTEDAQYIGRQYWDWFVITNGTDAWVYDGTNFRPLIVPEPGAACSVATSGVGSLNITNGWHYVYTYYRSDDGWESPPSPAVTQGPAAGFQQVDVTQLAGTDSAGVDKIRIYRTIDQVSNEGPFRYLGEVANPGAASFTTYTDTTPDTALSIEIVDTIEALSALDFSLIAVYSDAIWAAGVVEDGVRYPNRIRRCFPGKPWRWDALDFTDDIDGEIVALTSSEKGLLAFTTKSVYEIETVGGGAIISRPTDLPGTYGQNSVDTYHGIVAWISGTQVYAMIPGTGFRQVSDPPGGGSSIETYLTTINALEDAWLRINGENHYICIGVPVGGATPNTMLFYDVERGAWWRTSYAGGLGSRVIADLYGDQPNVLIIGEDDGTIIRAFSGESADGAALKPSWAIGPSDLGIPQKKRFRNVQMFIESGGDATFQTKHDIDSGMYRGLEQQTVSISGDVLDSTFVLDVSELAARTTDRVFNSVKKTGRYLAAEFEEQLGLVEIDIRSVHINAQVISWP